MTSSTSDLTMVPNAPPMMIPTARSSTLPRSAKALNSLSMTSPGSGWVISGSGLHRLTGRTPFGEAPREKPNVSETTGPQQAHGDCGAQTGLTVHDQRSVTGKFLKPCLELGYRHIPRPGD